MRQEMSVGGREYCRKNRGLIALFFPLDFFK